MSTRFKTDEDIIKAFERAGYEKTLKVDNLTELERCVSVNDEVKPVTVKVQRYKSGPMVTINFPSLPIGETSSKRKEVNVEYVKTLNGLTAAAIYSTENRKKTFLEAFRIK